MRIRPGRALIGFARERRGKQKANPPAKKGVAAAPHFPVIGTIASILRDPIPISMGFRGLFSRYPL